MWRSNIIAALENFAPPFLFTPRPGECGSDPLLAPPAPASGEDSEGNEVEAGDQAVFSSALVWFPFM